MKKTVLSIFGTRPEAIKMAPLVKALRSEPDIRSVVCVTGQHRSMLQQVLDLFDIAPDYDLAVMSENQTLNATRIARYPPLDGHREEAPSRVLVHGDTTTATAAALAAFHRRVPVGHVEAGLRTRDMQSPWPEEMNRRVVDVVGDLISCRPRARRRTSRRGRCTAARSSRATR